jgi:hypothetical protein
MPKKPTRPPAIVQARSIDPSGPEIIAAEISKIAAAMQALDKARLTRRALVLLINDHSGVNKRDIELVLNNLIGLQAIWLKKPAG